jgi:hypothetical protein
VRVAVEEAFVGKLLEHLSRSLQTHAEQPGRLRYGDAEAREFEELVAEPQRVAIDGECFENSHGPYRESGERRTITTNRARTQPASRTDAT